jgi:hypothetical protein
VNVDPFIAAEHAGTHNIKRACELLEVSRSGYYQHRRGSLSHRRRVDAQLTEKIVQFHAVSKGTYGAPRVHADLVDAGMRHGRKRVARLMRAAGLTGKSPRRWRTTTIPDPNAGKRPDLVNRDLGTDPAAVDTRWCADITYINTWQGRLYLATVIDLASRRIVGWAVADHLRTDLVEAALTDALVRRRPASGLVFHSDRGSTPATSTPASPLPTASGSRSAGAGNAGTTRLPSRSSPPSKPNCCTDNPGSPTRPPGRRYSSTSRHLTNGACQAATATKSAKALAGS